MAKSLYQMMENLKDKEKFVFTTFSVYYQRGAVLEDLQKRIDLMCQNYSKNFIQENIEIFKDENNRATFLKMLDQKGANLDASKRLLRQIYKDLKNFSQFEREDDKEI